jgi:hypothetical protein
MSNTPPDDDTGIYENANWLANHLLDPVVGAAVIQAAREGDSELIAHYLHISLVDLEAIVSEFSLFGLTHEPIDPPEPSFPEL